MSDLNELIDYSGLANPQVRYIPPGNGESWGAVTHPLSKAYAYWRDEVALPGMREVIDDHAQCFACYPSGEQAMVGVAFETAAVAHGLSLTGPQVRKSDGAPYITHPMEMTERMVGISLDMPTLAATEMHDVGEDGDLGPGLSDRHEWLDYIGKVFDKIQEQTDVTVGYEPRKKRKAGKLIADLVDGATDVPYTWDEHNEVWPEMAETPLGRMFTAHVERGGIKVAKNGRELNENKLYRIGKTLRNMEHLVEKALQSPDHWRIFVVKLTDFWHNALSPEFIRAEKILRGRIAANMAEYFGWYGMRSDLVALLGQVTDTVTPMVPEIGGKEVPDETDTDLEPFYALVTDTYPDLLRNLEWEEPGEVRVSVGWPMAGYYQDNGLLHPGTSYRGHDQHMKSSTLPVPEAIFHVQESTFFERLPQLKHNGKLAIFRTVCDPEENDERVSSFRLYPRDTLASRISTVAFGRSRVDYSAEFDRKKRAYLSYGGFAHGAPVMTYRMEAGWYPHTIDLFRQGSHLDPDDVPESGIFNNLLKSDPEAWRFHLEKLQAAMYEGSLPFGSGVGAGDTYMVIMGGNPVYMDGTKYSIRDIYRIAGLGLGRDTEVTNLYNGRTLNTAIPLSREARSRSRTYYGRVKIL